MRISELKRCNKVTVMCHGIICALIAVAYLIEVFKGSRTIFYWLMLLVLGGGPAVVEIIIYRKNPESEGLRRVVAYCYAVFYAVVVFTTTSLLPFTYIVPMLIVITLYGDIGYCLRIGIGGVLINIASIAYMAVTQGGIASEDLPDIEIRIIVMIIIVVYLYLTTKTSRQINEDKRIELQEEKAKIEQLLNQIMRLSGDLSGGVERVDEHMGSLDRAAEEMSSAMEEVASGIQETAESVQNQLTRTQEIQSLIEEVSEVGNFIKESMDAASGEMNSGVANMEMLARQSKQSGEANATVVELMKELQDQAGKMNEIIDLISSIASMTSLLALNASIEAARAGEAGAGFAVVATEVTSLAEQTKTATVSITELIRTITDELHQVTNAVKVVEQNAEAQNEKTEELGRSINSLKDMTITIAEKATGLEKMIGKLSTANEDIVRNIQTISAITEEVTAHSTETLNTCKNNQEIVSNVSRVTKYLNENAQELKNTQMQ